MVVVDSSALIPLIKIGRLSLLRKTFGRIVIPEPVWEEVVVEGKKSGKPVRDFESGRDKWFRVASWNRRTSADEESLESNDLVVLSIAKDSNDIMLTNDASLYYCALSQNVKAYWLTTLILVAVKNKKVSKTEAEDILLELVSTGGLHLRSDILSELLVIIRSL